MTAARTVRPRGRFARHVAVMLLVRRIQRDNLWLDPKLTRVMRPARCRLLFGARLSGRIQA